MVILRHQAALRPPARNKLLSRQSHLLEKEKTMPNLAAIEVKAFVPAKDFGIAKRFYKDLGFELAWEDDHLAEFRHGRARFLLQNFFNETHAANFMMHLLVEDVDAWWSKFSGDGIAGKYGVSAQPSENHPGNMRDFTFVDPTGVLWRVGQVTKA
jgi:hypothetical protein